MVLGACIIICEIVPWPSTLVGSPLSPILFALHSSLSHFVRGARGTRGSRCDASAKRIAARARGLPSRALALGRVALPTQLGRSRAIGRCSQAVVYALWPSYFRGNMMTIDKKLEMY